MLPKEPRRSPPGVRPPSLLDAIAPLVLPALLSAESLLRVGLDALDGPIQVALVGCAAFAALIVLTNGYQWQAVHEAGQEAKASVTGATFILLAVGSSSR